LRLNPNISEVEIISIDPDVKTGYGSPYEGERKKGEQTAAVTSGKGLKDYDGDGKVESGAKEYRGAVHNAIQRKKGGTPDGKDTSSVKEDYLYEAGKKKNKVEKLKKYDVMPPGKKNKITIGSKEGGSPDGGIINAHTELQGTVIVETGYSKFLKIVSSGKGEKEKLNPTKVDMNGPEVGCDDPDPRSMKTASNLVKTKLRMMGLRPLMMSNESEGDQIDEFFGPDKVVPKGGQISGSKNPVEVGRDYVAQSGGKPAVVNYDKAGSKTVRPFTQQDNMNRRKNTLAQNAAVASQGMPPLYNVKNSYEPEGESIDELNRYEKETGKDYKTGKSVTKGGTMGGDDTNSKVMRHMNKVMGAGKMGAGGPIQKRGAKKEPGKKPPEAGEYGSERRSPEQIVKNRRIAKQQGKDNMSSRFD
jgi:hypothetical protein